MSPVAIPDLTVISPELAIAGGALVLLILDLVFTREQRKAFPYIALGFILLSAFCCSILWGRTEIHFASSYVVDRFRLTFSLVILLASALVVIITGNYLHREDLDRGEFYALLLFTTLGMLLMAGSTDLIILFLGLETLSISLYILASIARNRAEANEAGLKYLLTGSFASAFLLYGIALVYGATGSTNIFHIRDFLNTHASASNLLLIAGIGLLLVGFGFKVAAFPFHAWVPDVYEGSPTVVTAFMATGVKAAAFAGFARVFLMAFAAVQPVWVPVLWWLSVLTMTIGNLVALAQNNFKRLLAYSSIAHAGYLLIGLLVGTPEALSAMVYYLLAYTAMTIGAFAVGIYFSEKGEGRMGVHEWAGFGFRYPVVSSALVLFMISLAGFPPTAGFFGKFYLFSSAVNAGQVPLVVIAVINSVISVFYYLRPVVVLYMFREEGELRPLPYMPAVGIGVALAALVVLFFGLYPSSILEYARHTALVALTR